MQDSEHVTVLRSTDSRYVDVVVAMLEAEGIPVQHPGKNHAALIPGLTFIEIEVRVPARFEADARSLIRSMREAEVDDDEAERMTFRVTRHYGGMGALLGFVVGAILAKVLVNGELAPVRMAVIGVCVCAGILLGRLRKRSTCSAPGCAGRLVPRDTKCGKCGATIAGVVPTAAKHFDELEKLESRTSEERPN